MISAYRLPNQKILSHHLKFKFVLRKELKLIIKEKELKHAIKKVAELGKSYVNSNILFDKICTILEHHIYVKLKDEDINFLS